MSAAEQPRPWSIGGAALVVGPALLVTGIAIGYSPGLIFVLPMGTAWVQGAVALPLVILGPGVLSLGWSSASTLGAAKRITVAVAVLFMIGIASYVALNVTQLGCAPVTNPIQTLPVGLTWGLVAGSGVQVAVLAGAWFARRGRPVAAVAAGSGIALVSYVVDAVAFAALFPPLLCRPLV